MELLDLILGIYVFAVGFQMGLLRGRDDAIKRWQAWEDEYEKGVE